MIRPGSVAATYWLLMLVGRLLGAMIGSKVSAKSMLMVVWHFSWQGNNETPCKL